LIPGHPDTVNRRSVLDQLVHVDGKSPSGVHDLLSDIERSKQHDRSFERVGDARSFRHPRHDHERLIDVRDIDVLIEDQANWPLPYLDEKRESRRHHQFEDVDLARGGVLGSVVRDDVEGLVERRGGRGPRASLDVPIGRRRSVHRHLLLDLMRAPQGPAAGVAGHAPRPRGPFQERAIGKRLCVDVPHAEPVAGFVRDPSPIGPGRDIVDALALVEDESRAAIAEPIRLPALAAQEGTVDDHDEPLEPIEVEPGGLRRLERVDH
jgi:hypothetical protein